MDTSKSADIKPNADTAIKAYEEYHKHGNVVTVHCERCGQLLKVVPLGDSAWQMTCSCGLYDSTFRGI